MLHIMYYMLHVTHYKYRYLSDELIYSITIRKIIALLVTEYIIISQEKNSFIINRKYWFE